jgi:hypothetical protein
MKKTPALGLKGALLSLSVACSLLTGCASTKSIKSERSQDFISNAEIRDVITRVATHQLRPLADGEYPAVTNLDQAKAAKAPEGIIWSYPWGVALYGVIRSTDVTHDKAAEKFVIEHDKICGRYYEWLVGLEKQFGDEGKALARTTKIKSVIGLGNLDSCGAMGNQLLETM